MEYKASFRHILIVLLFLFVSLQSALGGTIYVDANATGANNGSSWENAYIYLQDALTAAISGDNIWVAQGTYKPDRGNGITIGDRVATFELKAGVSIYGGFPIGGGTWEERDPNLYETILSGDLNGNDGPNLANNSENSLHVVHIGWANGTTTADGFIISGGNANGGGYKDGTSLGGGIYNGNGGNLILSNCIFADNFATYGGAVALKQTVVQGTFSGTTISCCTFTNNLAGGGAFYLRGFSPVLKNCKFIKNNDSAIRCDSFSGFPTPEVYSNPTIINTVFIGNHTDYYGGAIYVRGQSSPKLVNCIFVGNSAVNGGAIYEDPVFVRTNATYRNCTIVGNSASDQGGGMCYMKYGYSPLSSFKNCILWGNRDSSGINEWSQISELSHF